MDEIRTVAGHIYLSQQQREDLARQHCQRRSDDRYAFTGERSDCECGFHENPVPLAPLFDAPNG